MKFIDEAHIEVIAGGVVDDSEGWFVRPTVAVGENPNDEIFRVNCLTTYNVLEACGLLTVAIRPPTVPEGTARLRLVLRQDLPGGTLARLLDALGHGPVEVDGEVLPLAIDDAVVEDERSDVSPVGTYPPKSGVKNKSHDANTRIRLSDMAPLIANAS